MLEKNNSAKGLEERLKTADIFSEDQGKSVLPTILLIMGISAIIYHAIMFWIFIPITQSLPPTVGDKSLNTWTYFPLSIIIGIFIIQIFFGIKFRKKQKEIGHLSVSQRNYAIVLLLLGIFAVIATLIPMVIDFIIYYVYSSFSTAH